MLGSLDPAKVLVILVIALVVLGPERLPRAARQLGAAWRELTRIRDQVTHEVRSALPEVNLPKIPQGMVSGFVRELTSPPGVRAELDNGYPGVPQRELARADARTHDAPSTTGAVGLGPPARLRAPGGASAPLPLDDPGMN